MLEVKNRLGIVFFPAYDWAISPTHQEREERLLYTHDQLREEGVFDIEGLNEYRPEVAKEEDVARVHFCFPDVTAVVTPSHLISAGGAIKAARLVMEKKEEKTFALVRPPGHHAMKVVHGNRGFCLINIEAIMIEYIREHYGPLRIAVVDTDCHHGDGTQDIYWHDPNTLFISMHQDGRTCYPGSGFPHEFGGPGALGQTINIPLPPTTGDEGFLYVLDHIVQPILNDFKPDLIINSAGQDNHYTDPITNMKFTAQGYALLNQRLNPDIAVLEGGYSIRGALPYVNLGIILAMAGLDYSFVREPDYDPLALRSHPQIMDYIKTLSDEILNMYFNPKSEAQAGWEPGKEIIRNKNIFYDTDFIRERQKESIRLCEKCPGILKIETESTVNDLSVGIEVPLTACRSCAEAGLGLFEEALAEKRYLYTQFINRKDKIYRQVKSAGR
ncbi:MAG: histone deacetylase [Deltaproteobacteria bacterium]|nr:histone deacetylase [Deltaproteobacteria bacterium]